MTRSPDRRNELVVEVKAPPMESHVQLMHRTSQGPYRDDCVSTNEREIVVVKINNF